MAARFVYWMTVSLDLFIEHAHDEQGGGDWMSIGDELHEEFNARAEALTMLVQGRKVFETMESFWPEAPYNTTVFGGDDAIKRLGELRASSSGDIGVGGADVATQLLAAGLLDEVLLFTHPGILGSGRPLFDEMTSPVRLELLEQATYAGGVTMHRYAIGDV